MTTAANTLRKPRRDLVAHSSLKVNYLELFRSLVTQVPIDKMTDDARLSTGTEIPMVSHFSCWPTAVVQRLEVRESSRNAYGRAVSSNEKGSRATNNQKSKVWLNIQQVTDYLGISRAAAYRLVQRIRSFPAPGVGLRFLRDDIDAYVEGECRAPIATEFSPPAPPRFRIAETGDDEEVLPGLTREELKRRAGF